MSDKFHPVNIIKTHPTIIGAPCLTNLSVAVWVVAIIGMRGGDVSLAARAPPLCPDGNRHHGDYASHDRHSGYCARYNESEAGVHRHPALFDICNRDYETKS